MPSLQHTPQRAAEGPGSRPSPAPRPAASPVFLTRALSLRRTPAGPTLVGTEEEGRGRSWGKRRRRKTTSSPPLGRPVKVWRFLRPPGGRGPCSHPPQLSLRSHPPLLRDRACRVPSPGGRPRAAAPPPKMAGPSLRLAGLGAGPAVGRGGSRAPGRAGPRTGRTLTGTMAGRSRRSLR